MFRLRAAFCFFLAVAGLGAATQVPSFHFVTLAGLTNVKGDVDGFRSDARFHRPMGSAVDRAGNIYISDTLNSTIRKITPAGQVTTIAGSSGQTGRTDGLGRDARFSQPAGLALDPAGNLYVADTSNTRLRRIAPDGQVTTLLVGKPNFFGNGSTALFNSVVYCGATVGLACDRDGNLFIADTYDNAINRLSPDGELTKLAGFGGYYSSGYRDGSAPGALFNQPKGLTLGAAGVVYVADTGNNVIRKIANGIVTTVAGDSAGGYLDGVGRSARFRGPEALACDASGVIYVLDAFNRALRTISPDGTVATLDFGEFQQGSDFGVPAGSIALGSDGTIYVADPASQTVKFAQAVGSARPPFIAAQPVSQTADAETSPSLSVTATGDAPLRFQWFKDNQALPGATSSILTLANATAADTGTYTVKIENDAGYVVSSPATMAVTALSRIVNLSIRAQAGVDADTLITGFVVQGPDKSVLVRGIGPGLLPYGVTAYLTDPQIHVRTGSVFVAYNDKEAGMSRCGG